MCLGVFVVYSAFDTLAKVFNPPEVEVGQRLADKSQCVGGTTIQLIGRDQETPIIEVEGPLLTDSHVSFKVGGGQLLLLTAHLANTLKHAIIISSEYLSPTVL